ncbi:MAG: ribonuclease PH [Candidatus Pacebacteria bacterium]|nr:ribonuclease PH [Candidatus Paceibacterota bacterium]
MPSLPRQDGRQPNELRDIRLTRDFQFHPDGSVLIEFDKTRIVCAATVSDGVPRWMREQNVPGGWVTAEYQMLPSATPKRTRRESMLPRPAGRTLEIQRLIGRALRTVVDLEQLGARTIQIDCDVLDADGGTRCAAITGGCVALELAMQQLFVEGHISSWPLKQRVAAVSVGVVDGEVLLDLAYDEDSRADVDMNIVMTAGGKFVEVQGTAEGMPFARPQMNAMLDLAAKGIDEILEIQQKTLE